MKYGHFGREHRGSVSQLGSLYPQSEGCLYLNIWKADDESTEKKPVMVFDEFNIHAEKESERQLVDWERTYFLTKYYCI